MLVTVGALVVSVGANVVDVRVGALVVSVGAAVDGWLCCRSWNLSCTGNCRGFGSFSWSQCC